MARHDYTAVPTKEADADDYRTKTNPPPYQATQPVNRPSDYGGAGLEGGTPNYDEATEDDEAVMAVLMMSTKAQLSFIRRVYGILLVQLLTTTAVCLPAMFVAGYQSWMLANPWSIWVAFIASFGSSIFVSIKSGQGAATNTATVAPLALFTLAFSYMVSFSAAVSDPATVVLALFITLTLFFGLTLYSLQSNVDFEAWGPYLFTGLWMLVVFSLVASFFPYSSSQQLVLGAISAVIFSGYILYDTRRLMKRLQPGQEVLAAMTLYMDVVNLFLAILRILSSSSSSNQS